MWNFVRGVAKVLALIAVVAWFFGVRPSRLLAGNAAQVTANLHAAAAR